MRCEQEGGRNVNIKRERERERDRKREGERERGEGGRVFLNVPRLFKNYEHQKKPFPSQKNHK